jgi:hypothetical protein
MVEAIDANGHARIQNDVVEIGACEAGS